ncbi:hypothetical protein V9T40_010515 [Parthenolecanium corni]|uniref:Uncharacterized protein n=1 Tax=Parthenolecanium corni TaxID=536013 RepID=A0AAN9T7B0_9HEMI
MEMKPERGETRRVPCDFPESWTDKSKKVSASFRMIRATRRRRRRRAESARVSLDIAGGGGGGREIEEKGRRLRG